MVSSSLPRLLLTASACLISGAAAFAPRSSSTTSVVARSSSTSSALVADGRTPGARSARTELSMAGFGGGGGATKKKGKGGSKLPKLKAKTQWDRYKELKTVPSVTVGVRVRGEEEWMTVGRVRSADDGLAGAAVARQRALIAEHSKRLFMVRIPPNAALEWGYVASSDDEGEGDGDDNETTSWVVVDKSAGDDAPDGIEKKIGFEGISDKASGFYCYYHEGRVVEREEEGMGTRGSGFKAIKGK